MFRYEATNKQADAEDFNLCDIVTVIFRVL
jgi:hypothetical protein